MGEWDFKSSVAADLASGEP